jgi:hypothetical protein
MPRITTPFDFEDAAEAARTEPGTGMHGVAAHALDPDDADRLWDGTARLLRH